MNFKESKAIYLQIADRICDEILLGQFGEEERIGYFVSTGARELIHSLRKNTFLKEELDYFFKQIKTLDIPIKEITDMYREFCKKEK